MRRPVLGPETIIAGDLAEALQVGAAPPMRYGRPLALDLGPQATEKPDAGGLSLGCDTNAEWTQ
jgi:hypothetical protein